MDSKKYNRQVNKTNKKQTHRAQTRDGEQKGESNRHKLVNVR